MSPREPEPLDRRKLKNKWSTAEVAWVLGVAPNTVWRWLSGAHYPTVQMLRRIETKFSWSAYEQLQLIPDEGHDVRYGMVFRKVLNELTEDLPELPAGAKRVRKRTQEMRIVEEEKPAHTLTPGRGIMKK